MKRSISFILCLIMCFTMFSGTAIEVVAVGKADRLFTVKSDNVADGKLTFTVGLKGGLEGFGGTAIHIAYDKTVLAPVEIVPAQTDGGIQNFDGIFEGGIAKDNDSVYCVGYTNTMPVDVLTSKDFFTITFNVIDSRRPSTSVGFYCKEFYTSKEEDSITVDDGVQLISKMDGISTMETPKLESAKLLTNAIVFKWKKTAGVTEYEIRRKTPVGAWTVLGKVPAEVTEYTDKGLVSGNTYIYSVKAVNEYGSSSFDSTGVSCKYISKPTNVKAKNGIGGIDITWDKTEGADEYQIVRREESAKEWKLIAKSSVAYEPKYKDTTAVSGKTYEYDVNSTLGTFVTDTAEAGDLVTYLASPVVTSVANVKTGIEIVWDKVSSAEYYIVYKKSVSDGETEFKNIISTASASFIDENVQSGKTYAYTVQAISKHSDESGYNETGYSITRVTAANVTEVAPMSDKIKITWTTVDGIDGYVVYRKAEGSEWEKIGNATKTATTFEDLTAESGKSYFYSVVPFVGATEGAKVAPEEPVYYIMTPQDVMAVNVKDAIKVSWSACGGATEYIVFRKTNSNEGVRIATVSAGTTEYIDKATEGDNKYSYYVQAISAKGESEVSEVTPQVKRIECVQGIKTVVLPTGIKVEWEKHKSADSYIVCRRENGMWSKIIETTELEYLDKTVKNGVVYAYSVIPVVGAYEGGIDESTVKDITFFVAPIITETKLTENSIVVYWGKVDGAKSYEVQRANADSEGNASGSFETIATVTADKTMLEDRNVKAGKEYIYRVYSVDGENKSVASDEFKSIFLGTQKIKSLSNGYGGIKITWYENKGAEKYHIRRKEGKGDWVVVTTLSGKKTSYVDKGAKPGVKTEYSVLAEKSDVYSTFASKSFTYFASPEVKVKNVSSGITLTWEKVSGARSYYVYRKAPGEDSWKKINTVTKTRYTDESVKAGKVYKYTVRAYDGDILSGYNTSGWAMKRLTIPKLKSTKNATSGVTVKWSKVTGATKYIIKRKAKGSSKWESLKTTKSTSYTDKTAKSGVVYTYTVVAGNGDYRSSYNSSGIKVKRLSRPSLSSVKSGKKGVTFKWKQVTGASGYYVYRKTGSGEWKQLAKVTGGKELSYLDTTAKKGKTYYYSVRAYSGSYKSTYNTKGLKIKDKY